MNLDLRQNVWRLSSALLFVVLFALLAYALVDVLNKRSACSHRGGVLVPMYYQSVCVDSSAVLP